MSDARNFELSLEGEMLPKEQLLCRNVFYNLSLICATIRIITIIEMIGYPAVRGVC